MQYIIGFILAAIFIGTFFYIRAFIELCKFVYDIRKIEQEFKKYGKIL